jgi:RNA polymerase sigma factor (sigma-70 family)
MTTMAREIKLLKKCLKGNTQAFEVIVTKYQELICAITFSGTADVQQSEELAHQTFINAWKNLSQLKDLSRFRPWLCSIARNNIRNFINKNQRDIITKAEPMENINDRATDESGPLETAIKKEHKELVSDAIKQVPEQYRELLVLYYRQQQSVKQVALLLDLSEDVVKQRLQRGRKMIKEQLKSIVEETLSVTGPKKAFATAVIASVTGMAIKGSGVAAAAGIATTSSMTGTTTGVAAITSGVTAKIITAAAVLAIGIGAVVTYKQVTKSNPEPKFSQAGIVTQEQGGEQEKTIEEAIETPSDETAHMLAFDETQIGLENKEFLVESSEPVLTNGDVESKFEPKGVLSGLITDAQTGEPVTDAEVTIGPGRLYRTKTDENGLYSFDLIEKDGDYSIGVYSKEYIGFMESSTQPTMHLKKDGQVVKHFQLPKACMIDLYVFDEEGNPVKDARVWVTSLAEEHGREVGRSYTSQRTNENGNILLGGFSPSNIPYMITSIHSVKGNWVEKYGQKFRESVPDFAPGYLKVELINPDVIEYGEIVLSKGIQIQGFAQYTDGTPAKECKIIPYPDWWHSTTVPSSFEIDPNGLFTLNHITPGTYRIQAMIPSGEHSSIGITLFSTQLPLEKDKLLEVTIPRKPTTNAASSRNEIVEVKLYGIITDALTGKPIPEFRLRYQRITGNHYGLDSKWTQFNNDKGDFTLDVIGNEHAVCKVQAVAEGYAPEWSEEIDTAENKAVLIELHRGGSIAGVVVDAEGNPVVNAKILPYSLAGDIKKNKEPVFDSEEGLATTDNIGRFTLKNIAAGAETIKITHPDYTYTIVSDIPVKEGKVSEIGLITLNNGGIVEGFVYDNQGEAQSGVTLYAQNHYGFSTSMKKYATEITDPNGYFHMENLPEDLCYIVRPQSYQQTGVVSRAVIPVDNKVIRQDFGGGPSIRGQLVIDGNPLKDARLTLTLGKSSVSGLYRCHAETDEYGGFVLSAGLPGTYTLSYNRRTKYSSSTTIKLKDILIGSEDIDLGIIPSKEQTLTIWIEASDQQQDAIRFFYLRENDPLEGACIFWKDEPSRSEMPYMISIPEPGLYYAIVRHGSGGGEYRYPIDISEGQEFLDVKLSIQEGNVTVTGVLPEQINHVYFTNYDQSISGILFNDKNKGGAFVVDGLFPGTYYLNPKWPNYDDSIIVTIPDSTEYTLNLDAAVLIEKLKERVSVHVFDQDGQPAEYANVWIESNSSYLLPASQDNYSSVFYLPSGEHIIHAERDGINATRVYRLNIDKNNTASGESFETFIQLSSSENDN